MMQGLMSSYVIVHNMTQDLTFLSVKKLFCYTIKNGCSNLVTSLLLGHSALDAQIEIKSILAHQRNVLALYHQVPYCELNNPEANVAI